MKNRTCLYIPNCLFFKFKHSLVTFSAINDVVVYTVPPPYEYFIFIGMPTTLYKSFLTNPKKNPLFKYLKIVDWWGGG